MSIISRRTLLKKTSTSLALAPILLTLNKHAFAALPLANAVEFLQGSSAKTGSVILSDTTLLNFPISFTRFFFSTAYELTKSLPATYPGKFSLFGMNDALGHSSFAVNMLPPSNFIPGSTVNPSLQIFLASNSAATNFVSYVIPDFTIADGTWHTMQISLGLFPSIPATWIVNAVDFNNSNNSQRANIGYYTNETGDALLPSQAAPVAFNIPAISTGLAGGDKYVFWMGQPVTSKLSGYKPVGGPDNWLDTAAIKLTQTLLHLTPVGNVITTATLPQFVNIAGPIQTMLAAMYQTEISALLAEEATTALIKQNIAATYLATQQQAAATVATATSALNTLTLNGAPASVQSALASAKASVAQAQAMIATQNATNYIIARTMYLQAQASANEAVALAKTAVAAPGISTSSIILPNKIQINNTNTPPHIYLSGNGNTNTIIQNGVVVTSGGSGSYYQNQIYNIIDGSPGSSLITPSGYPPAQQSPDDSYSNDTSAYSYFVPPPE